MPDAVQNVKDIVLEMKDIPKGETKRHELSYRVTKDVLKATNIFSSPQYGTKYLSRAERFFEMEASHKALTPMSDYN